MKKIIQWIKDCFKCSHKKMKSVWFDRYHGVETFVCGCGYFEQIKRKPGMRKTGVNRVRETNKNKKQ